MDDSITVEALSREIRKHLDPDPQKAKEAVRSVLERELGALRPEEKIKIGEEFIKEFSSAKPSPPLSGSKEGELLLELLKKVLGGKVQDPPPSSEEIVDRLSEALNTVFNSLNELIAGINTTLLGKRMPTETIRFMIGSQLGGPKASGSIQTYIDQIKEAFSIAHQAFQDAAQTKFKEFLEELDPEGLEKSVEGGIKFGPLKKAELFEIYREKFQTLKNWLESGLLLEATMREFEKACQRLYAQRRELR